MTAIPTRPQTSRPSAGRPTPRPAPTAAPAFAVDPVKLLRRNVIPLGASLVAGVALGVGLYFLFRVTLPRYDSRTVFEAVNPSSTLEQMGATGEETDRFIAGQVQHLMSSTFAASVVADTRGLEDYAPAFVAQHTVGGVFDAAAAARALDERGLRAAPRPGSNFFDLIASHENADVAHGLARVATNVYTRWRQSLTSSGVQNRIDALARRIADLEAQQARLIEQRRLRIADAEVFGTREELRSSLQQLELQNNEKTQQNEQARVAIERLTRMLTDGGAIELDDAQRQRAMARPDVSQLRLRASSLEAELNRLRNLGITSEQHPAFRSIRSQIDGTREKLDQALAIAGREIIEADLATYRDIVQQNEAVIAKVLADAEAVRGRIASLQRIEQQLTDLADELNRNATARQDLENQITDLRALEQTQSSVKVNVIAPPERPDRLAFPQLLPVVGGTAFLCVGLVGGLIFLREALDQRVRGPGDIRLIPGATLIGFVPDAGEDPDSPTAVETAFRDRPSGALAESVRQLRTPLLKKMDAGPHRSLVIAPAAPGSGATALVSNLAFAAAASGRRVLLVDANFRRPALHRALGLGEAPGLADILADRTDAASALQHVDAAIDLISAGSADLRLPERLGSDAMRRLLDDAGSTYDLVLIDCAPAALSGDGKALAEIADASALVCRPRSETRGLIGRLVGELTGADAEFLGVVVNAVQSEAGGYLRENIRAAHAYSAGKS